jgi:cardiolipin synthase (CMP-forming)
MQHEQNEKFWTIPNMLSLYRLLVFPFVLWLVYSDQEKLFSIFITISLVSDVLDGLIARIFKLQTAIGAKLDSWADLGTYILAFYGIWQFKWEEIRPHLILFLVFALVMLLSYLFVFIKFKGLIGLHTYMFKITGYLQGAFIVSLFVWGFFPVAFYIALIWGTVACIEEIIIIWVLKKPTSNVKGLYWIMRERNGDV